MTRTDLWCPFADREPVVNHGGIMGCYSYRTRSLGVLLHVTAGYGDPDPWFNTPAAQASATWYIAKNGRLAQYMSATARAWAQMAGNDEYQSVETEGEPGEPLTDAQVATFARLYAWAQAQPELAWPLHEANADGQEGLGWHGMSPAFGHPFCPGELRKAQRPAILALAAGGATVTPLPTGEFTMDAEAKQVLGALAEAVAAGRAEVAACRTEVAAVKAEQDTIRNETYPYFHRIQQDAENTVSALGTANKGIGQVGQLVAQVPSKIAPAAPVDAGALATAVAAAMTRPEVAQAVLAAVALTGTISLAQAAAPAPAQPQGLLSKIAQVSS